MVDVFDENNLDKYKLSELIGEGANFQCYEIKHNSDLVMVILGNRRFGSGSQREFDSANRLKIIMGKIPNNVNFARILEFGKKDKFISIIMQKAKGKPLHDRKSNDYKLCSTRLLELANIKQEHYDKLIEDMKTLHEYNLMIDPSKPDNIFYDSKIGFTFIDLNYGDYIGSLEVPLIWTYNLFSKFSNFISKENAMNIKKILNRLQIAKDIQNDYLLSQIKNKVDGVLGF